MPRGPCCCPEHCCAPSSSELPSRRVPLRPLSCCLEHRVLRATVSRVTLKKVDVSALHHWDCDKCQPLSAGAILVENRGFSTEIGFSPFGTRCVVLPTARDSKLHNLPPRSSYVLYLWLHRIYKYGSFCVHDRHQC